MKKYSILLMLSLLVNFSLSAMDPNSEQPKGNQNFWNKFNNKFNFDEFKKNSEKMFEKVNTQLLTTSNKLQERYPSFFNKFKFEIPKKEVPIDDMKKVVFGTATNFKKITVMYEDLVLPWHQKHSIRLAVATAAVGFLGGTLFGWKVKSFFGPKKSKVAEE